MGVEEMKDEANQRIMNTKEASESDTCALVQGWTMSRHQLACILI